MRAVDLPWRKKKQTPELSHETSILGGSQCLLISSDFPHPFYPIFHLKLSCSTGALP